MISVTRARLTRLIMAPLGAASMSVGLIEAFFNHRTESVIFLSLGVVCIGFLVFLRLNTR